MSFIGILTNSKSENILKHLFKEKSETDNIFYLNERNINNVKNIKFETVLIGKKIANNKEQIREIAQKAKYLVLNTDEKENIKIFENVNVNLITYGFNLKSTVTISSIEEEFVMVCLQRGIISSKGENIDPQEIELKAKDVYTNMEEAILMLLYPNLYCNDNIKLQ